MCYDCGMLDQRITIFKAHCKRILRKRVREQGKSCHARLEGASYVNDVTFFNMD